MNTAHLSDYGNLVLERLGIEPQPVAFWEGLWKGIGDTTVIPKWYVDAYTEQLKRELVKGMLQVYEETKADIEKQLDADWQRAVDILQPDEPSIDDSIEAAFIEIDPPFDPHE